MHNKYAWFHTKSTFLFKNVQIKLVQISSVLCHWKLIFITVISIWNKQKNEIKILKVVTLSELPNLLNLLNWVTDKSYTI